MTSKAGKIFGFRKLSVTWKEIKKLPRSSNLKVIGVLRFWGKQIKKELDAVVDEIELAILARRK